jgi:hypothetical protein
VIFGTKTGELILVNFVIIGEGVSGKIIHSRNVEASIDRKAGIISIT